MNQQVQRVQRIQRIQRLLAPLLLLVGCVSVRDIDRRLPAPRVHFSVDAGVCGENIVVDGDRVLWRERGCENGSPRLRRIRRVREDHHARLVAAIAALPADRTTLTAAEHRSVIVALASMTSIAFDHPCLTPTITHTDPTGLQRTWQPEACPPRPDAPQ